MYITILVGDIMESRIYITHCCAKKNDGLRDSGVAAQPQELYTSAPTVRFMSRCKLLEVKWAIFSDLYGVWFPSERHEWYEKPPNEVTENEFRQLLSAFDASLSPYEEIWFYHNPGRFHRLYRRIIADSRVNNHIHMFSSVYEISKAK